MGTIVMQVALYSVVLALLFCFVPHFISFVTRYLIPLTHLGHNIMKVQNSVNDSTKC